MITTDIARRGREEINIADKRMLNGASTQNDLRFLEASIQIILNTVL